MPETEERPDRNKALAFRDETTGSQIDGSDVICVQSMAETEGVGEDGGGEELGVIVEEDGGDGPDDEVDGDEEVDEAEGGLGDGGERRWKLDVSQAVEDSTVGESHRGRSRLREEAESGGGSSVRLRRGRGRTVMALG